MKTYNFLKTKSLVSKFAKVGVAALMLASCGKDNVISSNGNLVGTSPVYSNPAISPAWNQLKSTYPCKTPEPRTEVALTVATNQGQQGNRIQGNLVAGQTPGSTQGTYLGADYYTGDLISVTKVVNGNTSSYNIVMSMCAYKSQYGTPIIGPGVQLNNYQILDPIMIAESTKAYGDVMFGSISFMSSASPGRTMFDSFTVTR